MREVSFNFSTDYHSLQPSPGLDYIKNKVFPSSETAHIPVF